MMDSKLQVASSENGNGAKFNPLRASGLQVAAVSDGAEIDFIWIKNVFQRGKKILFICIAACLVLGATYCVTRTKRYEAVALIAVHPEASDALNLGDTPLSGLGDDWSSRLETEVRVLKSSNLAEGVISELHLDQCRDYVIKHPEKMSANERETTLLGMFDADLKVDSVPRTQVIEIKYRNSDPKLAADTVNALARAFQERNFVVRYQATQQASKWLTQQLTEIKSKVEDSQGKLADFQKKTGIIGTDENNNIVMSKLDELNRQVNEAQADRIEKEAKYRIAQSGNADVVTSLAGDPHLLTLKQQQRDLEAQLADAQTRWGNAYPKVVQLRAQLAQVKQSVTSELQSMSTRYHNEYVAAKNTEDSLRAAFDKQKQQAYELSEGFSQYGVLKREVDSGRDLYEDLLKRLEEAGVVASLRSTNVDMIDPAREPILPVEPKVALTMLASLLMGVLLGSGAVFVRDRIDHRVGTPEEAEWIAHFPLLGIVPLLSGAETLNESKSRDSRKVARLSLDKPRSQFSEAFRTLRTSLRLASAGAPPKTIVITGSEPGEGKTTVSVNCATVFAQSGGRILLVDADMRRGTLMTTLGLQAPAGLAECLAGGANWREVVRSLPDLPNLQVLVAGTRPPNPAELLGSGKMSELLQEWSAEFDCVILDTPPAMLVTDAMLVSQLSDAAIIVARHSYTNRYSLKRTCELMSRASRGTIGLVLNAFDHVTSRYYSAYAYGYAELAGHQGYYDDEHNPASKKANA